MIDLQLTGELINRKTANINVKTTVYTHADGDIPSHIENSRNKKKLFTILLHVDVRRCTLIIDKGLIPFSSFYR